MLKAALLKTLYFLICLCLSLAPVKAQCWLSNSGGYEYSLGIKTDGTLWAWGDNRYGQLGDGTTTTKNSPNQIGTDNNWKIVSGGIFHSIALKTEGSLWAFGFNTQGL